MKAELLQKLNKAGLTNTFKNHPVWIEAFEEYKKATGDSQVNTKCSSCFRKVLQWLKK